MGHSDRPRDPLLDAVLPRFSRRHGDAVDLPAARPGHAAIARVWMLGDRYVLRARTLTPTVVPEFRRECTLIERVRGLVPWRLPEPLPADDGELHVALDGALWTLHRAIPGRILCPWQDLHRASDADRIRLVRLLRAMHDATLGRLDATGGSWLCDDVRGRLDGVRDLVAPSVRARLEAAIDRHAARSSRLPASRAAFVHGDFHGGNLLLDDSGAVTGMVDLDWCRAADPVEDLGYLAMMLARDPEAGRPRFDALDDAARDYGLDASAIPAFRDTVALYALFDVHLFRTATDLRDRERYVACQLALLEALCAGA